MNFKNIVGGTVLSLSLVNGTLYAKDINNNINLTKKNINNSLYIKEGINYIKSLDFLKLYNDYDKFIFLLENDSVFSTTDKIELINLFREIDHLDIEMQIDMFFDKNITTKDELDELFFLLK